MKKMFFQPKFLNHNKFSCAIPIKKSPLPNGNGDVKPNCITFHFGA